MSDEFITLTNETAAEAGIKLIRPIVPMEQWVNSFFYLGPEADNVYPYWKEKLIEFHKTKHIKFIMYGSYRVGKNYISIIEILRMLYEISCIDMNSFLTYLYLSPTTRLKFAFVSFSIRKATSTGISRLIRMFDAIPYFQKHCPRDKRIDTTLRLSFIDVVFASTVSHLTGEDLYGVIFDEADFVRAAAGDEYDKAKDMFLEAQIRGMETYSHRGRHYGMYGLLSSAQFETSFTENEIRKALDGTDPAFIMEAAVYDVKPKAFSSQKFRVFIGTDVIPAHVVDSCSESIRMQVGKELGVTYNQFLTMNQKLLREVPVNFRPMFDEDVNYAIKTICGIPRQVSGSLLKNQALFQAIFKQGIPCPVPSNKTIYLSLGDDSTIADYVDVELLREIYDDNEGADVYVHYDLAKKGTEGKNASHGDAAGFSAVFKGSSGRIRTLLYLQIKKSETSDEIDLDKCEDIVYFLMDAVGINLGYISMDSYASDHMQQSFTRKFGKERVGIYSVDKEGGTCFPMFLYFIKKSWLEFYAYEPFMQEFPVLLFDPASGKVTCTKNGTQDISEAVVASTYQCYSHEGMDVADITFAAEQARKEGGYYGSMLPDPESDIPEDDFFTSAMAAAEAETPEGKKEIKKLTTQQLLDGQQMSMEAEMIRRMEERR